MTPRFPVAWLFGAALAPAVIAGCSFQNFDYLKDEFKSAHGGTGGSSLGGAGGHGGSPVSSGGSGNAGGGSTGVAGTGGSSGGTTSGGGDDAGSPPVGMLNNPGFEQGFSTTVTGWTSVGDVAAAYVDFQMARTGSGRLGHWLATGSYKVSTSQVISPLPDGNYTFSIWVRHDLSLNASGAEYIFARGYSLADSSAELQVDTSTANDMTFTQIVIPSIPVTSGTCEVGIYTAGGPASGTNWSVIDDAEFTLVP